MVNDDDIFTAQDPRGINVRCTEDRWVNHILDSHPFLYGWEDDVRKTIEHPHFIGEDATFPDRQVYYRRDGRRYIKVVIKVEDDTNAEVWTAFLTDSGKSGETIIWMP